MTYDATGNLLCRKTFGPNNVLLETRDFLGNFEYINNVLVYIHTSQGRYKSISAGVYRHEYTIEDHLGNTRVVYSDLNNDGLVATSEILDENHYYAYGMELPGSWINVAGTNYNYKFNGIERVEAFNMDFAFYRGLDPVLGRWYQVDPKAEYLNDYSPYTAMMNNPITYNDPDGDIAPLVWAAIAVVGGGYNLWKNWDAVKKGGFSKGLSTFAIGAGAAVVGTATGGVVASALPAAITTLGAMIQGGLIVGAGAGVDNLITGTSNALMDGKSFKNSFDEGLLNGAIGLGTGFGAGFAITGAGIGFGLLKANTSSISSKLYGVDCVNGRKLTQETSETVFLTIHESIGENVGAVIQQATKGQGSLKNISGSVNESANLARNQLYGTNKNIFRRLPNSAQDIKALTEAQAGNGRNLNLKLGDPNYQGWEKWHHSVGRKGSKSVVHYLRNPKNGVLADFKFK